MSGMTIRITDAEKTGFGFAGPPDACSSSTTPRCRFATARIAASVGPPRVAKIRYPSVAANRTEPQSRYSIWRLSELDRDGGTQPDAADDQHYYGDTQQDPPEGGGEHRDQVFRVADRKERGHTDRQGHQDDRR